MPVDVLALEGAALTRFRRRVQFIFQDPFGSLNPRMTVGDIIAEPLVIHDVGNARTRAELVSELLALVGLHERDRRPLSAQFLGRPAAAHRHRPRAGAAARSW